MKLSYWSPNVRQLSRRGVILGAGAAALAGCSRNGSVASEARASQGAADQRVGYIAARERGSALDLTGTTLAGRAWSLQDYRGKVVILNKWASWCPPCRAETPLLVSAYESLAGSQSGTFAFWGVNSQDNSAAAIAWERKSRMPYGSVVDSKYAVTLEVGGAFAVALPGTVVLDTQGRIGAQVWGAIKSAYELTSLAEQVADAQ